MSPFGPEDLTKLDALLERADAVVTMDECRTAGTGVIGMRHDVDHDLRPAVALGRWEHERGYRSTYFILHSAPYWQDKPALQDALAELDSLGHDIGFHTNAIATALRTGQAPAEIVKEAVDELRSYGYPIKGVVAHGDQLCHKVPGGFVNDEMFTECARDTYGRPDRTLEWDGASVQIQPEPLATFGFEYDANRLSRRVTLSDAGGRWYRPFDEIAAGYPYEGTQLHALIHPCWWKDALGL